jgi:hypothetical protein
VAKAPDATSIEGPRGRAAKALLEPLRAGMLVAGACLWTIAALESIERSKLYKPSDQAALLLVLAVGLAAIAFGYTTPVKSYAALVGRVIGAVVAAALSGAVVVACITALSHWSSGARVSVVAVAGLALSGLSIAWARGPSLVGALKSSPRARWGFGFVLVAVAVASPWPPVPTLRCWLGSCTSCRDAAIYAIVDEDDADALAMAKRGCALRDATSCRLAGDFFARIDYADDRHGAEPFYRDACAYGASSGCDRLRQIELQDRCEQQSASACRELADGYGSRDARRVKYRSQACLLGDGSACD